MFGYYADSDLARPEITQAVALSEGAVEKHVGVIWSAFGMRGRGERDQGRAEVQVLAS